MTAAGELKYRLVLEAPVETPDGQGGVALSYATAATVWASLQPAADRPDTAAGGRGAVVTHHIIIRAGPELTTRHRFRLDTRIFRVVAVREQDAGRFLFVHAEEKTD
jgi:SPP1 family predicted phage head-tail adaptor